MIFRIATLAFGLLLHGLASAQPGNLLKNPNGEEGMQGWRVFGEAAVTDCMIVGNCFAISKDGFIYQDVTVSDTATGDFAVLIGLAAIDEPNPDPKHLAHPYLFGYFMSSADLPQAKILANLTGQEMSAPARLSEWIKQYGIFKIAPGTVSIRLFLRSGCPKTAASEICTSRFRKPGVFRFRSEAEARVFVDSYQ
jgi:hypothetical protein